MFSKILSKFVMKNSIGLKDILFGMSSFFKICKNKRKKKKQSGRRRWTNLWYLLMNFFVNNYQQILPIDFFVSNFFISNYRQIFFISNYRKIFFISNYRKIFSSVITDKIFISNYRKSYGQKNSINNYRWNKNSSVKFTINTLTSKFYALLTDCQ